MKVEAPGIRVELPTGWEADIDGGASETIAGTESVRTPRAHLANFPLPVERGDFGSGAVEQMIDGDALVCLLEESSEAVGSRLHELVGIPRLRAADFSPNAMQRPLAGQSGTQKFFHTEGRAFVLYVVMGSHTSRRTVVEDVNRVLDGITILPD